MEQETEHNTVKLIRLTNGDDIISELVEVQQKNKVDHYTLINPLRLVYMASPTSGYLQIGFTPFVYSRVSEEQEFTISIKDVLLTSNVSDKMVDYYFDSLDMLSEQEGEPEIETKAEPKEESAEVEALMEAVRAASGKRTYH